MSQLLWGIDVGGTKIEGVVVRPNHQPEVLFRERISTGGYRGYEHVLTRIRKLVDSMSDRVGEFPKRIGFGTPGAIDRSTGLLRGCNSTYLNNQPLDKDLETLLGVSVIVENDANCFTLAETRMGIVAEVRPDAKSVFGVIMGTGVGGGLVINKILITGKHAIAGEWGHNFLDASGGPCYCGRTGCVETVISGPGLENYYTRLSGRKRSLEDIVKLAREMDSHAIDTLNRLIIFFGKSIATVINIVDPDVIVIGGGVGNIGALYTDGIDEVAKHIFAPTLKTKITKPKLGDSAGVFGAAYLVE